jgi:hypothetical protein
MSHKYKNSLLIEDAFQSYPEGTHAKPLRRKCSLP